MQRIRIRFAKNHLLRYTGTLDVQKIWERVLRRGGLPVSYSKGFHPQPKIQIACPLPLGMTSRSEYIDFWLEEDYTPSQIEQTLNRVIHKGFDIQEIQAVALHAPSLQSQLYAVIYKATIPEINEDLPNEVCGLLDRETIMQERRGKQYDLRPLIEECTVTFDRKSDQTEIIMRLTARPGATGRPEEVLKALNLDPNGIPVERQKIIFAPGVFDIVDQVF